MTTNFSFLKNINKNLYDIIQDAENLYRDEYFEQCMTQTRRFGEVICKTMLEENGQQTGSFDNMLATLQDKSQGTQQEKEFIEDLYFLKKNGNKSVHSNQVQKEATTALECLKRAFEIAINYCVYVKGASRNILKPDYDIDLLITGEKTKPSLAQKYKEAKKAEPSEQSGGGKKEYEQKKSQNNYKTEDKKFIVRIPLFWKIIAFLCAVSFLILGILSICMAIKKIF